MYNPIINEWVKWECSVNINLFKTPSFMNWYDIKDTAIYPEQPTLRLNGIHYGIRQNSTTENLQNFQLLNRQYITNPTLVRTGIPHNVENLHTQDRWCISLRFKGNPSFEECLEKLCQFIIKSDSTSRVRFKTLVTSS